jgi:hypothetical protein
VSLPLGVKPGLAGHEILALTMARQALARSVLLAVAEGHGGDWNAEFTAWGEVDRAAMTLATARRRYDRHVRKVAGNARATRTGRP